MNEELARLHHENARMRLRLMERNGGDSESVSPTNHMRNGGSGEVGGTGGSGETGGADSAHDKAKSDMTKMNYKIITGETWKEDIKEESVRLEQEEADEEARRRAAGLSSSSAANPIDTSQMFAEKYQGLKRNDAGDLIMEPDRAETKDKDIGRPRSKR